WWSDAAPSRGLPSGRLRPSEPAIGSEGGTRWSGYGEGRGEGAFPQLQARGGAPSPGICTTSAQIPTSPRKRGEVEERGQIRLPSQAANFVHPTATAPPSPLTPPPPPPF